MPTTVQRRRGRRSTAVAAVLLALLGAFLVTPQPARAADTGHITGTVRGGGGPLTGWVYAYTYQRLSNGFDDPVKLDHVTSDGSGRYIGQWWDNKPDLFSATDITVSASGSVSGIDAQLGSEGHLTGRVTDMRSQPLAGISVGAYRDGGLIDGFPISRFATSGSDGSYDVDGLPSGRYRLKFADYSGNFVSEYWIDQPTTDAADLIKVRTGRTVRGKNAQLTAASSISGVVRGDDGEPISGVQVSADLEGRSNGELSASGYTTTDATGAYTVEGLRSGDYIVAYRDFSGGYLSEFWKNEVDYSSADTIPVTVAADTRRNVRLVTSSHLTGTLTSQSGRPISRGDATAYTYDRELHQWTYAGSDYVDSSGHYDVDGLRAGTYRLEFVADGYQTESWDNQPTLDEATDIQVPVSGVVAGKDAELAPEGGVTGKVSDSFGHALQTYAYVSAYTYDTDRQEWVQVSRVITNPNGQYTLGGLGSGVYRIGFRTEEYYPYALQFWHGASDVQSAQDVQVTSGSTVDGVNAHLVAESTISGHAVDSAGNAVGTFVQAYRRTTQGSFEPFTGGHTSNHPGNEYVVHGLPPGTYRLQFEPYESDFAEEFYNDASTLAAATDVVVTRAGQAVELETTVLAPSGSAAQRRAPSQLGEHQYDGTVASQSPALDGAGVGS